MTAQGRSRAERDQLGVGRPVQSPPPQKLLNLQCWGLATKPAQLTIIMALIVLPHKTNDQCRNGRRHATQQKEPWDCYLPTLEDNCPLKQLCACQSPE